MKFIDIYFDLPENFKPIHNKDGTVDYPVVLASSNADTLGEVVDPASLILPEAAFVGYNHYKCDGLKVQTGAEILHKTLRQTDKTATVYIRVKETDEMFFCDTHSLQKKTNGKLLQAVRDGHVSGASVGCNFDATKIKMINGIRHYFDVIVREISLLDVAPANFNTRVINKNVKLTIDNNNQDAHFKNISIKETNALHNAPIGCRSFLNESTQNMENPQLKEKNKCLQCISEAGEGTFAINPQGVVVKVTTITDIETKGIDFDGNEIILDDTFEPVTYEEHKDEMQKSEPILEKSEPILDKSCSCKKAITNVQEILPEKNKATEPVIATANPEKDLESLNNRITKIEEMLINLTESIAKMQTMNKSAKIDFSKEDMLTIDQVKTVVTDALNIKRSNSFINKTPGNSENALPVTLHPYL